jgi:hypothetical protein
LPLPLPLPTETLPLPLVTLMVTPAALRSSWELLSVIGSALATAAPMPTAAIDRKIGRPCRIVDIPLDGVRF